MNTASADADAVELPALPYRELISKLGDAMRQSPDSLALLFVDLAGISRLQAQLGFRASAALLVTLADKFALALRDRGTILRFSDGGFCVLVSSIRNCGHAVLAAEKLTQASEDTIESASLTLKPQMNIGIALYPLHAPDPETLLRKAQLAAAAARQRDLRLLVFDEACAGQVMESWQLGGAFAAALQEGELQVYYQPKLRVAGGQVAGAEALMRWLRNGQAVTTPDVFIPLAEEAGLIRDVTWYALSNALQVSARCSGLPVAVNVTPAMLHHREFVDMIATAAATWSIKPQGLTIEVTEGALIADFDQATQRLSSLRDMGVRVSIDDFGTGYSSLSYFKKIPADELKVDKSFVLHLLENTADQQLVQAIITLAHQFKLDVVAEGVETPATLALLARLGCDYVQGYLFAPALGEARLREWLTEQARRSQGALSTA